MRVNPLRCARGQFDVTAGTQGAVSLFNNDSTKYLRVLDFTCFVAAASGQYVTATRLTTKGVGIINPVVTGEGVPPGLLDTQDLGGTFASFDYIGQELTAAGVQQGIWFGHGYPFAVLRPGWSFVTTAVAPGGQPNVSFFWDWVWPDELTKNAIGDPEIDY